MYDEKRMIWITRFVILNIYWNKTYCGYLVEFYGKQEDVTIEVSFYIIISLFMLHEISLSVLMILKYFQEQIAGDW